MVGAGAARGAATKAVKRAPGLRKYDLIGGFLKGLGLGFIRVYKGLGFSFWFRGLGCRVS